MATTIKDSVYKAIDVIVGKRIEDLHLDKTIEATVDKCLNLSTGKYRLRYGSGIFDAYANADEIYMPNTAVYVLVPENDFNKKKTIIGRANTGSQTNKREEEAIASMYNGYSVIGQNILVPEEQNRYNLASYLSKDNTILLYDANRVEEQNLIHVDNEKLKIYLEETKGFIFSGKFKTNFHNTQALVGKEEYGLIFNLALKNGNTSFENMQARWTIQEPKTISGDNRLNNYKNNIEEILINGDDVQIVQEKLDKELTNLQLFAAELDFLDETTLELVNLYIQLINELINYDVNINNEPITITELQNQYNDWFTGLSYGFQEDEYTVYLNTNNMTGNVYRYNEPTYQYTFAEIDASRFVRINSIYFYSKNFATDISLSSKGDDIQVSDVSITCIKYLDNINGDYRLDLEYEDIYFSNTDNDKNTLTITAKLIYKNTTDVTDYSQIMWFKQNSKVNSSTADGYSMYGGIGWEHITSDSGFSYNRSPKLTIKAEDNKVYRNKYKTVGMYESGVIVQQEFIIYNEKYKHNIELVSDSGFSFGEGSGKKKITCLIDGNSIVSDDYSFVWYKETSNGDRYQILNAVDIENLKTNINDIEKTIQEAEDTSTTILSQRITQKATLNALEGIEWNGNNYIFVDSAAVPNRTQVKIICAVIAKSSGAYLGEVDINLTSGYTINLKNYYIEIINGNQVFQYNEAGIAPNSVIYEDPLTPQSLSCKFYDPNGGIINPLKYNVSWQIPLENTLIYTDTNILEYNPITEQNDILKTSTCSFNIQNEYNYNATQNQIICFVEFNDGDGLVTYRQPTNFFFGKIGDDGTNGTDVVAKIDVINNKYSNNNDEYNNNVLINELLTLKIEEQKNTDGSSVYNNIWNNGLTTNAPILQLQLYRRNSIIDASEYRKVNWSVLNNGLTSKYWRTQNTQDEENGAKQAILLYDSDKNNNNSYTNYIIKAQADLPIDENKFQTYYNFYPICTDLKYQVAPHTYTLADGDNKNVYNNYNVGIDRARTLRQVVYNSDGRNPLYDKNLGVGLTFKNLDYPRTITWEPHGGVILEDKKDEVFPAFSIGKNISYITNNDTYIEDMLANLEEQREKELQQVKQTQWNGAISTIRNKFVAQLTDLQTTEENYTNEYNNLITDRTKRWDDFYNQRKSTIDGAIVKLYNLIDEYIEDSSWKIEDYIYLDDALYYSVTGEFEWNINQYLILKTSIDSPNSGASSTMKENVATIENNLLNFNLVIDEIEDEEVQTKITQTFDTLINLIIVGYQTYKMLYDRNNQELNNQINDLSIQLNELEIEIQNYEDVINQIDLTTIEDIIKEIIFENSLAYESLKNNTLLSMVLLIKSQFDAELQAIAEKYNNQINFLTGAFSDNADPTFCSIIPNEVYSGEYPNQYVKVKIYQGLIDKIDNSSILEHELIIPFHMSLNTYGLASLNAWDGSSVEINEDEGYVLAPQIGAGIKHTEDNTFTGVLMGTEKTFDDAAGQEEIGLLGYSHGKRSIFLDATTGNATFGLPEEDAADASNPLTEGRIELRPGGTSSISKWNFDSRSIYRVSTGDEEEAILQTKAYEKQATPNSLGAPYEDAPQYAHGSIPHTKQGILLSALPAYASFKGRILTNQDQIDQRVNYLNLNTTVREGDTFELQIDPNDSRFFSLYEHSARIYEGSGACDTLANYKNGEQYALSINDFNEYFNIFINRGNANFQYIDENNTLIITQRYIQTVGSQSKQVFRPLAYLNKVNNNYYWQLIDFTIDKRGRTTNERVIGILKQYSDWQNNNSKNTIWTYATFIPTNSTITRIPVNVIYDENNNLIEVTLIDETIVNEDTKVWHRYKKAGIDATGKFVSEGVGTGAVGLGLNDIQAFNLGSLFIGANFESNQGNIIQFFVDKLINNDSAPVFISSTKTLSNNANNNDEGKRPIRIYAGQDYENLNTGIFVGKNAEKDPVEKISKIELSQTGPDDNKIILSALGTDPVNTNQSILTLVSSSDISQQGSLIHTGNWKTEINKNLNKTVGGDISLTGKSAGTNNIILQGSLDIASNNSKNKITMDKNGLIFTSNIDSQKKTSNTLKLLDNSDFTAKQKINIVGGLGAAGGAGAVQHSVIIDATNTSGGLVLRAFNGNVGTATIDGNNIKAQPGVVLFQMRPTMGIQHAAFYLYASGGTDTNAAMIYNSGSKIIMSRDAEISHDLKVINNITAKTFKGDGADITNTAAGVNAGPAKDIEIDPGYGKSGSFNIPQVTMSNGRPKFTNRKITITMPIKQDLTNYATKDYVDKQLESYLKSTDISFNPNARVDYGSFQLRVKKSTGNAPSSSWAKSINTTVSQLAKDVADLKKKIK